MYLCQRDANGNVVADEDGADDGFSNDPHYWFVRHWKIYGLRDDQIEKLWEEEKCRYGTVIELSE